MGVNMRIYQDLKAYSNGSLKKAVVTLLKNPCFHSVLLYRVSNFLYRIKLSPLSKIIWYFNRLLFHVDIDYRANLAGGFVLVHGLGTVIGAGVRSNGRLKVCQGVTIGGSRNRTREYCGKIIGQPVLEDNVTVYTGSGIFGPCIIGKNVVLKAHSVTTEDVQNHIEEKNEKNTDH